MPNNGWLQGPTRGRKKLRCSSYAALAALLGATAGMGAQSCTTTITGKVYSPLGPSLGDPIPNILVYVATTPVAPFTTAGPGSCATPADAVSGTPLVSTTTNAAGVFTLNSTGLAALGNSVNVVIQAGKWRRQNQVAITPCGTTSVNLTMPANQSQGDLPHIAIITGSADGIECIFRRIGISDSEFTDPSAGGSINLYEGTGTPGSGGAVVNPTTNPLPSEPDLVESPSTLNNYDLVMFGCQGTATDAIASGNTNSALNNLVNYANNGGRIFATHYGYVWLDNIQPFESSATWATKPELYSSATNVVVPATINPNYAQSATLSQWLQNVGASYNGVQGQVGLYNVRVDTSAVNNPPAQSWVNLNNSTAATGAYTGNPSVQFTFDTPINTSTAPSIALSFANTPTSFVQGDAADKIAISVTNTSTATAADSSLNLSLTVPSGVTATALAGSNPGTGWVCSLATLSCNRTVPLAAGATDPLLLIVSIAANAPIGSANVPVTVSGGGLTNNLQCGRVLFNDYHVENSATTGTQYPKECATTALTPQEKFLEFSLYNLSNFVAPVSTDVIVIQGTPTITWPTPASIYYGTPLSATQLDATASYNGVNLPGTFVYTPPAGTIEPVGDNILSVLFTPTDTTDYTTATATVHLQVLQDTTGTTLTSFPNPSNLNQSVAFTATVVGNAAVPTGTVNFYDAGVLIGSAPLSATGVADTASGVFNIGTLAIGKHNITACYPNTTNFGPSCSPILVQTVLVPSTTTISGLVSPIYYGQIIGDTATITVNGASSGGTLTVYIDNVNVCVLNVVSGVPMTCPPSTGAGYNAGNHSIYAVFSGDAVYSGSQSQTYNVQILPDLTQITVASSLNPSTFGQSVTFTATMSGNYATPVGPVVFYDGGTAIGTGPLAPTATADIASATFSTAALAVGSHNITVGYAATLNFNAAASTPALVQVVIPPPPNNGLPGFGMTVSPTDVSVGVGNNLGITITIVEYNGFGAPTQLACSGLPIEATCTFVQSTIPAGGGTTTLFISPAAPHSCTDNTPDFVAPNPAGGLALLGVALLLARRRRKLFRGIALAMALLALPVLQGCGAACLDFGTKPGNYSFTVTGTAAGAQPTPSRTQTVTMHATI